MWVPTSGFLTTFSAFCINMGAEAWEMEQLMANLTPRTLHDE